jgi:hypothetical protein
VETTHKRTADVRAAKRKDAEAKAKAAASQQKKK